ncbi:sec-independent translocase [Streptomyces sp. NPDC059740]|uniref:sec-independent translocase n=1 Tax=Streptomyces sp. NPDC059740 TaxID=3346926 RepID=UPI00364E61D8
MFFDIGPLELVALVILAVLVFGPDKLPKVIHDVMSFVRKVREFSDNAKQDIRNELGPEFKDFEFEDLNPKNFVRKHVLDKEEYGLQEIRDGFDLKKELAEVTDSVSGTGLEPGGSLSLSKNGSTPSLTKNGSTANLAKNGTAPNLSKNGSGPAADPRPPFDADAT